MGLQCARGGQRTFVELVFFCHLYICSTAWTVVAELVLLGEGASTLWAIWPALFEIFISDKTMKVINQSFFFFYIHWWVPQVGEWCKLGTPVLAWDAIWWHSQSLGWWKLGDSVHSKRACGVVSRLLGPMQRWALCLMRAPEMSQGDIVALHSQLYRMLDTGTAVLLLWISAHRLNLWERNYLRWVIDVSDKCHVLFQVSLGTSFPSHSPHGLSRLHISVWSKLNPRVLRSELWG